MSYEINIYFAQVRVSCQIVNSLPVMQNNSTILYPANSKFISDGFSWFLAECCIHFYVIFEAREGNATQVPTKPAVTSGDSGPLAYRQSALQQYLPCVLLKENDEISTKILLKCDTFDNASALVLSNDFASNKRHAITWANGSVLSLGQICDYIAIYVRVCYY